MSHSLDLADVVTTLGYLFLGEPATLSCIDAADATDDSSLDLGDAVFLLFHLYAGGPAPPEPFPTCGEDTTEDLLRCESFWICGNGSLLNSEGVKLLPVLPGSFEMGSPETERGRWNDELLHPVVVACGFYMSETEITQGQYLAVMGENPSYFNGEHGGRNWGTLLTRPVDTVSWHDAVEFCRRLSESEGRTYRLPYEYEWEYACRAGTKTRFWFGDVLDCLDECLGCHCPQPFEFGCVCAQAIDFMYFPLNPGPEQDGAGMPVGRKKPNPWGFYGFNGWLHEWCQDWYGPYPKETTVNPKGPADGTERVWRGGAPGIVGLKWARSAKRFADDPNTNETGAAFGIDLGFRIVLELPTCEYGD